MQSKQSNAGILGLAGAMWLLLLGGIAQARDLPDFTALSETNSPAVVNISTEQNGRSSSLPNDFSIPDLPEDSPFGDMLKRFLGEQLEEFTERDSQSLGSGFVISSDGYILTAHHVIADADQVQVRFSDRRAYDAKVIGSDKASDVALIKIDAENLPTVKIGTSKELDVGEWVLAIGSPFGFDHTVTAGIVSAKGRSLPTENYVPFIQTDVAINPGNSGGPLFDLNGEVIGINSQIYSRTGGFMGLSFAIPIDLAMEVANQLREHGKVRRGYLGVLIQDVDRDLADSFGMPQPAGALVAKVMPDSPADKAGVQVGDVILAFNDNKLLKSSQLPPLVGITGIDAKANLTILRKGKEIDLPVVVGRLPDEQEATVVPAKAEKPKVDEIEQLGLVVIDIEDDVREELGLDVKGGAVISDVREGPGREAGLRRGDIVTMFDGTDVKGASHLRDLINDAGDKESVAVLLRRGDSPLFRALKLR